MPQVDHASPKIDAVVLKGGLKDFNSHVLANIGCAFATARHASPVLFGAIAEVAQGCLKDLTPEGFQFSRPREHSAGLCQPATHRQCFFNAIAEVATVRLKDFTNSGRPRIAELVVAMAEVERVARWVQLSSPRKHSASFATAATPRH